MTPLTDEENESHIKQEICHICKKKLVPMIKYRGAAPDNCNLNYQESK